MHSCYIGMSGSGKSYLAQAHARFINRSQGREILVFDPRYSETPKTPDQYRARIELLEGWDNPAFITGDKEEFADVVLKSENCAVYIDESVEFFDGGRFVPGVSIVTRGRHMGHAVGCIGQYYYNFPTNVRENFSSFFCFRAGYEIAKTIAKDAGSDAFKQAPQLRNRQCIAKVGDQDAFLLHTERIGRND